jgi:Tfp pilus assembly protein PilE
MKVKMKKYTIILLLISLALPQRAHAGRIFDKVKSRLKNSKKLNIGNSTKGFIKKGLDFLPGGGLVSKGLDMVTGGSQEEKIDGIFDGVVDLADDFMQLKKLYEIGYHAEMNAQRRTKELKEGWAKADIRKLYGGAIEETVGISINPADYIPNIPETAEARKNIDFDMDHERKLVRDNGFYLKGTRGALLKSEPDLWEKDPEKFKNKLQQAEKYEEYLKEALRAQDMAMLKEMKAEIERLKKENKVLEDSLKKPGIKPKEALQTRQLFNNNKTQIIELTQKAQALLKSSKNNLSEEDQSKLASIEATGQNKATEKRFWERRKEIREDYRDLSLLNF